MKIKLTKEELENTADFSKGKELLIPEDVKEALHEAEKKREEDLVIMLKQEYGEVLNTEQM